MVIIIEIPLYCFRRIRGQMARRLRIVLRRPQRRRLRLQGPDEERPSVRTVRETMFRKSAAQKEGGARVHSICHHKVNSHALGQK